MLGLIRPTILTIRLRNSLKIPLHWEPAVSLFNRNWCPGAHCLCHIRRHGCTPTAMTSLRRRMRPTHKILTLHYRVWLEAEAKATNHWGLRITLRKIWNDFSQKPVAKAFQKFRKYLHPSSISYNTANTASQFEPL